MSGAGNIPPGTVRVRGAPNENPDTRNRSWCCSGSLRHCRVYLIGVRKLKVKVDAQYIKGMMNDPDLQPHASIDRCIQGILLFDFELARSPFPGP